MTLVQSWIDSLQLLKPKNLQPFLMKTLKSIIETYTLLFKYFWWLIAIIVVLFVLPVKTKEALALCTGIAFCLSALVCLAICFATRPSVEKKDCHYFLRLYKKFIICWFTWLIFAGLLVFSRSLLAHSFANSNSYSPWYIFFVLFFVDTESTIKSFFASMWNALKMVIFNLPLLLVMGSCFYFLRMGSSFLMKKSIVSFISQEVLQAQAIIVLSLVGGVLLLPFTVCTYANIYIKKLHDQFDLYAKQPQ